MGQLGTWLATGTIRRLLRKHDIRPKSKVKRLEGAPHPERDTQFSYIQRQQQVFEQLAQPMLSVDTKKKELIGDFGRTGQVWCAQAPAVNVHDFPSEAIGKAVP